MILKEDLFYFLQKNNLSNIIYSTVDIHCRFEVCFGDISGREFSGNEHLNTIQVQLGEIAKRNQKY